jgi:hypothetical protein
MHQTLWHYILIDPYVYNYLLFNEEIQQDSCRTPLITVAVYTMCFMESDDKLACKWPIMFLCLCYRTEVKSQLKHYRRKGMNYFKMKERTYRWGGGGNACSTSIAGHVCGDVSFVTSSFSFVSHFDVCNLSLRWNLPACHIDSSSFRFLYGIRRPYLQNILQPTADHSGLV